MPGSNALDWWEKRARHKTVPAFVAVLALLPGLTSVAGGSGSADAKPARAEQLASGAPEEHPFHFENNITPLLSRFGCNAASCHGKAEGQNGLRLSVFGYDPEADYKALVVESRGRRVFPAAPDTSLLLQKMSGGMPHGGGTRVPPTSQAYQLFRNWIAAGAPFGSDKAPKVQSISLSPVESVAACKAPLQLRVEASYSDGRSLDVTWLAQFQSNNESLAGVDAHGLATTSDLPGQAAIMARFLGHVAVAQILVPGPAIKSTDPTPPVHNFIDQLVDQKLDKLNLQPSGVCSDAEFLRRAYLDLLGTLPTAKEARSFLSDGRPERRQRLVDELLQRPEYADFWALRWADVLRVDRQALGQKDAYAYFQWIRDSIAANKPFDKLCRELVTMEGPLDENPQGHFYKLFQKPGEMASTLSQVFLGVRLACAECHHHPFDRWGQSDYFGMAAYFQPVNFKSSSLGESLLIKGRAEAKNPRTGQLIYAHALGAGMPVGPPDGDPRPRLADWLTSSENQWFARNLANRLVAHFYGRGLIEPVDDVRATNPATNPELLGALSQEIIAAHFDLKKIIRTLTAARTYQLSSRPNETNARDHQNYSRALFRRLPAEVLLDAVCQTTGVGEKFKGLPAGYRAIQLWDNDVSHYFLKLFGRPVRKSVCECERSAEASIGQVLHLLNAPQIQEKLSNDAGAVAALARRVTEDDALINELYLTFFSRFPASEELRVGMEHLQTAKWGRRAAAEDLAWTMINSLEFIFNH